MPEGTENTFGDVQVVAFPTPAVATGFTHRVPGSERQLVLSVTFQLVSDANAATRRVAVSYKDAGSTIFAAVAGPFTQTATHTVQYSFSLGASAYGDDDAANIGGSLPYLPLLAGQTVVVSVTNVQAGDQLSACRIVALQDHVRP